jgi:type II secretory pathway component PulK
MKTKLGHNGSVMLMAIFAIALLSVLVAGMLQMNTEEIQLVQNQIFAVEALATAEAGLCDAFSELRVDPNWNAGFADKAFDGGSYTVDFNGSTITSTGTSSKGFVGRVEADITIGSSPPCVIRIDHLRINE